MKAGVVITGLGLISCVGADTEAAARAFVSGACGLVELDPALTAHLRARYAGLVRDVAATARLMETGLEAYDRHVMLALVAAREALSQAGVVPRDWGRRLGFIFSTCSGPMLLIEAHYERILAGRPGLTAEELYAKRYYAGAQVLSQRLGIGGPCTTVVTACTASTAAIGLAVDLIRCGAIDGALAGGADSFSWSTLAGFDGLKATSESRCAPFSKPYGLNLGEAAGFVFLERNDRARERGVRVRAELLGTGMSNDAYHPSAPEPSGRGLASAIRRALADAGLEPSAICYVNAHGTGTEANDKAEVRAMRKVFGGQLEHLPVSSTKSQLGHCLGAAGAAEVIATILCAEAGVLPSTASYAEPREGCALDCVPEPARPWIGSQVFLSNNAAFGGHNACLVASVRGSDPEAGECELVESRPRAEVVITGCGVVTALGLGSEVLQEGAGGGRGGLQERPVPGFAPILAGMVSEQEVGRYDRRLDLRDMDRSSRWATVASLLAIREARYSERPKALADLGLYLSLSAGPSWAESEFLTSFLANDRQVTMLSAFPYIVPSSVSGNVCRALLLTGHNVTLCNGPGAGLFGLGLAAAAIRGGHAGAILSGAVDELTDRILADGCVAGEWGPGTAHKPGEGAAVFLLEDRQLAERRGARPLAVLAGHASSTEAMADCGARSGHGRLEETVREALAGSGLSAADLDAVCVFGEEERICDVLVGRVRVARGLAWTSLARRTGLLEGAQPLVDLVGALRAAGRGERPVRNLLAVASTRWGMHGAVVLKRVDI